MQPFLVYGFAIVNFLRPPIRYRHYLGVDTVIRPFVNIATFYSFIRIPPSIQKEPSHFLSNLCFRGILIATSSTLHRYRRPTPVQKHALPGAIERYDVMCCAQTGCFPTLLACPPQSWSFAYICRTRDAVISARCLIHTLS